MNEAYGQDLCQAARMKTILLQEQMAKKTLVDKDQYKSMQEELANAQKAIEKLNEDKEKLKKALVEAVHKRDCHYQQYMHYKKLYDGVKSEKDNPKYIEIYPEVMKSQELSSIREKVKNRDSKIQELYDEIQRLEGVLIRKDVEINSWKELYGASKYITNEIETGNNFKSQVEIMQSANRTIKKIKNEDSIYKAFKELANCSKYFLSLLEHGQMEEALLKLLNFIEHLLVNFKIESLSMRTPSFSPNIRGAQNRSKSSENPSPQVSIINPEISMSRDQSEFSPIHSKDAQKTQSKAFLRKPRISRPIKNAISAAVKNY